MTEIIVNRDDMDALLAQQIKAANGVGEELDKVADSLDGGAAAALIAFVAAAAAEAASSIAEAHSFLAAVVVAVLDDWQATEEQAEREFAKLLESLGSEP